MRKVNFIHFITCLILIFTSGITALNGQRPKHDPAPVAVIGWSDDTHYLIKTYDGGLNPLVQNMDINTAKRTIVPPAKSEQEIMSKALPRGITLTGNNVISADGQSVILDKESDLYFFKIGDRDLKRLTYDNVPEVNFRFSPDEKKIAYTKNKDLYVYDLTGEKEIRLTFDASEKIYNGYSSWVYMEEILGRDSRYAAFWWSPDGKKIAYLRTDDSDVPVFTLNRLDEPDGIHGKIEATPYPEPGDPNPKVKMGVADISTGKTVWVKTDYSIDQYIAWPFWTPDSKNLAVQVVNRDQNNIKIILADPLTGDYKQIYNENRNTWVEFFENIYVMKNGSGFIIKSYRNDWLNLYYYGWDGRLIKQITDFKFDVISIERVDEEKKIIYFSATGQESTDKHFFKAGLDGKNLLQITSGSGTHDVSISPAANYYIDTWNSIENPGSIIALDKKANVIREIYSIKQKAFDPSKNQKTELVKIMTSDGLFNMPATITYPVNFDPQKRYPVIFEIYGGPGFKNVTNTWTGNDPSWNSQNGIITFTVDHRGSGQFGMKGLEYLYRSLGKWEILDYEDAVKWLRTKSYIDSNRIGITGTSYGGYMTCLALTKGADYWTHGFAGMSVTDYRLYDNIYTERYMDTPENNPEGYKEGSSLTYAKNLKGKLYIIHGDMDDNVHLQNSIYLISRLQDEGKSFEFMLYPDGRHGWPGAKAVHWKNEANKFWLRSFFGE